MLNHEGIDQRDILQFEPTSEKMESLVREIVKKELAIAKEEFNEIYRSTSEINETAGQNRVESSSSNEQRLYSSSSFSSSTSSIGGRQQPSSSSSRTPNIATRLNSLLSKISHKTSTPHSHTSKKSFKVQIRWKRNGEIVKQCNGGGNRFISFEKDDDQTFHMLLQKALSVYYSDPSNENHFGEDVIDANPKIFDCAENEVFLSDNIPDYLKKKGFIASRTFFVLVTTGNANKQEEIFSEDEEFLEAPVACNRKKRKICNICSNTYINYCLRCMQDEEFKLSQNLDIEKDKEKNNNNNDDDKNSDDDDNDVVDIASLRSKRVTLFQNSTKQSSVKSLERIKEEFRDNEPVTFVIRRKRIFSDVLKKMDVFFRDKNLCAVKVEFVSFGNFEGGVGEGPLNEMFTLFYEEARGKLSYGSEKLETLTHDHKLLAEKQYLYFGKLVALAVLGGHPTPKQFSDGLVGYILGNLH